MKRLVFVFSFVIIGSTLFSQTLSESFLVNHKPEFMLPSPEVISRIKHIERPSGISTGIPKISIPLWHSNMSNYSINLKYHASGIQVNELSSCVGIGWSLDAGGFVARVVRDLPDDLPGLGYLYLPEYVKSLVASEINLYNTTDAVNLIDIQEYDLSPDIFYYSFNGISGKFVFDSEGNIITIPRSNVKITAEYDQDTLKRFIIQTTNGIKYRFGTREKVTIDSSNIEQPYASYYSAWFIQNGRGLTKESLSYGYDFNDPITLSLMRNLYEYDYYNLAGQKETGIVKAYVTIETPRLVSISDINSSATFNYDEDDKLSSIQVSGHEPNFFATTNDAYDQNYRNVPPEAPENATTVVRDIILKYGNYQTNHSSSSYLRKRRLDSIKAGNVDAGLFKKYALTYNSTPIPSENSLSADVWGYYNAEENSSLIPKLEYLAGNYEYLYSISGEVLSGAARNINPISIKAGILEQIENPQGGITKYYYEPNDFSLNESIIQGAGLRIDSIAYYGLNSDSPEKVIDYHYTYFDSQTYESTGVLLSKPNFGYNLLNHPISSDTEDLTFRYANYSYGLMPTIGNPIYYKQVTIQDGLGYTVKDFEIAINDSINSNLFSDHLSTSKIVEQGGYVAEIQYLEKEFRSNFCYDWSSPYMYHSRVYDRNDILLNETLLNYSEIEAPIAIAGFYSGVNTIYTNEELDQRRGILRKYYYPTDWRVLTQKIQKEYKDGNEFNSVITNFNYYNLNEEFRFLKESNWMDVNGNTHFKKLKYPFNYTDYSDPSFTLLSDSLEIYEYRLSRYMEGYVNLHNNEEYYANHNILPISITYTSGYNSDSIAEPLIVKNADENLVALLTLKARGIIGSPVENIEGIILSGDSVITSASVSTMKKNDLQVVADKNYILQGPLVLNPGQLSGVENCEFKKDLNYKMIKEYTEYNEDGKLVEIKDATGVTTSYDWSVLGNYMLSKTLNGTQTVSYSYLPLIGIESQEDPNGNIIYYSYDAYGNLNAKRDVDNNVREIYTYNSVNSEGVQQINDSESFLNPKASLTIVAGATNGLFVRYRIDEFIAAYNYVIDFGDGSEPVVLENSLISYSYAEPGSYNVNLKVKLEDAVLNERFKTIVLENSLIDVNYTFINSNDTSLLEDINEMTIGGLEISANVTSGTDDYEFTWDLTNETNPELSFSETDNVTGTDVAEFSVQQAGSYILRCTVSDGANSSFWIWNFTIE